MKQKGKINELVENYRPPSTKSKEEAWQELNARLQTKSTKHNQTNWLFMAAAIFAAVLILAVVADSLLFYQTYSTGFAEQKNLVLPDESEVLLNPNSHLKVNYSFINGQRKLELAGEAFFSVKPGKAFTVKFRSGKVKVLGTRFVVTSYKNIQPEVNCLSGKVKVKSGNKKAVLTSGEGVQVTTKNELKPLQKKAETVLKELQLNYTFENEPLKNIFSLIEAQSGYRIKAAENISERKFSGELNLAKPEKACNILSFAMDIGCTINHQLKTIQFEAKK